MGSQTGDSHKINSPTSLKSFALSVKKRLASQSGVAKWMWTGVLGISGLLFFIFPGSFQTSGFLVLWGSVFAGGLFWFRQPPPAPGPRPPEKLLAQSRDVFWQVDAELKMTGAWGAVEAVTGMTMAELRHTPFTRLFNQEDAKRFEALAARQHAFTLDTGIQKPDGGFLAVKLLAFPENEDGQTGFQGILQDISAQRRLEKNQVELTAKLDQWEKLRNLGLLAGTVAHDLNNILSGIATYPEVLLLDRHLDAKTRSGLEMIRDSGRKASSVVGDLLTISRGTRAGKQILNLNTLIKRYMASAEFEKVLQTYGQVTIEVENEPELLNISGSYIHIEKSVMNLMLNAVEEVAKLPGGKVMLFTANHYGDETPADHQGPGPGEYVKLSVADNGHGIPAVLQDKIFDPFFTQKEMGRSGTGLGLTVVMSTVKDHNGTIQVHSTDQGTRFDLYFPATREEMPEKRAPESMDEIKGSGQTLLVVDDLASQRKIACTILEKLGYQVYAVENGMEAVEFVKKTPVDLLVLDMVMAPHISGYETYRRIKQIQPDQKAIIASGHSESEDVLNTQKLGAGSFVTKPYTILDMGIAVKEELEN